MSCTASHDGREIADLIRDTRIWKTRDRLIAPAQVCIVDARRRTLIHGALSGNIILSEAQVVVVRAPFVAGPGDGTLNS